MHPRPFRRLLQNDAGVVVMNYVVLCVLAVAAVVGSVVVFGGFLGTRYDTAGKATAGGLSDVIASAESAAESYESASARAIAAQSAITGGDLSPQGNGTPAGEPSSGSRSGGGGRGASGRLSGRYTSSVVFNETGGTASKGFVSGDIPDVPQLADDICSAIADFLRIIQGNDDSPSPQDDMATALLDLLRILRDETPPDADPSQWNKLLDELKALAAQTVDNDIAIAREVADNNPDAIDHAIVAYEDCLYGMTDIAIHAVSSAFDWMRGKLKEGQFPAAATLRAIASNPFLPEAVREMLNGTADNIDAFAYGVVDELVLNTIEGLVVMGIKADRFSKKVALEDARDLITAIRYRDDPGRAAEIIGARVETRMAEAGDVIVGAGQALADGVKWLFRGDYDAEKAGRVVGMILPFAIGAGEVGTASKVGTAGKVVSRATVTYSDVAAAASKSRVFSPTAMNVERSLDDIALNYAKQTAKGTAEAAETLEKGNVLVSEVYGRKSINLDDLYAKNPRGRPEITVATEDGKTSKVTVGVDTTTEIRNSADGVGPVNGSGGHYSNNNHPSNGSGQPNTGTGGEGTLHGGNNGNNVFEAQKWENKKSTLDELTNGTVEKMKERLENDQKIIDDATKNDKVGQELLLDTDGRSLENQAKGKQGGSDQTTVTNNKKGKDVVETDTSPSVDKPATQEGVTTETGDNNPFGKEMTKEELERKLKEIQKSIEESVKNANPPSD